GAARGLSGLRAVRERARRAAPRRLPPPVLRTLGGALLAAADPAARKRPDLPRLHPRDPARRDRMGHAGRHGALSESLVLLSVIAAAVSGVPGLFLPRGSRLGQRTATALSLVA